MTNATISIDQIRDARQRAANIVKATPLDLSTTFSGLCGREIYLKLENLQKTGSFKVRGALNKIQLLDAAVRSRGVITASAGNHAQGVAYAARIAAVPATVVMPTASSFSKYSATVGYGAEVLLAGHDYNEAYTRATQLAAERQATFVHAFDDADVHVEGVADVHLGHILLEGGCGDGVDDGLTGVGLLRHGVDPCKDGRGW
jgi:threonine dehydratase